MTNLREELLSEIERQEELRQRRTGGVMGNRLNEGRENWQEFKDDLLSSLEERMQEWPLLGDRHQNSWLATPEGRGFKYGAMAAALAIIIWLAARKNLEPLLKGIVRKGMEAGENIQSFFSGVVEDFQNLFAEAQFERTKDILDKEIACLLNRK
jgi:hypothetical protein